MLVKYSSLLSPPPMEFMLADVGIAMGHFSGTEDWDIRWTGNCRHIRYLAYTWFFSSLNLSGDGSPRVT